MIKNMKKLLLLTLLTSLSISSFSQNFSLADFYSSNLKLTQLTDSIYNTLSDTSRVGQMIITSYGHNGKKAEEVEPLVKSNKVGGIIYLKGTHQEHFDNTLKLNQLNTGLPLLFSMDAEPSLMEGRISTLSNIPKTNAINSIQENRTVAQQISNELNSIGVRLNFSPDCDMSTLNTAIGSRSYGDNKDTIISKANSFINASSNRGIVTCAKHFPGHGLVTGDSHHQRVFIDGQLKEIDVYKGVLSNPKLISVIVGHIDIINNKHYNTKGRPSSCSSLIIKNLLQQELGFKGLIISDALGMKALKEFEFPGFEASKAGCDILCMPKDENDLIEVILQEMKKDKTYRNQIEKSVKKIIRLKLCLGLFQTKPMDKVVLYQHGKIIEEQGVNAVSPTYGKYEYINILNAFKEKGYNVLSTVRKKNADPEIYATRLAQKVDSLIILGYKPEDITLIGASKGAWITLLASSKLSNKNINIVSIAVCGDWTYDYFKENELQLNGRILSIYESSDKWNQSCSQMNFGRGISDFQEIEVATGLQHGIVFHPLADWLSPSFNWIENKNP